MLLNSRVTDAPEMVRCTLAARRRRHREKFIFWRGVFAAQGRPRIKLTEDMEDSTPPSDNEGAKLLPVTDAECGASYKESPEQSDETHFFCRWNLSDTQVACRQYSSMPRLVRFCPRTQGRIPVPPPGNSMPSWEDDGDKTLCIRKQENPGVGGPAYNKLLAAGDGNGALEDAGKGDPYTERRNTPPCRGHQRDSQGLVGRTVQWSRRQESPPVRSGNTGQDSSGLGTTGKRSA